MKSYYQLQVSLNGSKPKIWRRFLVPPDIRLPKLHAVLQIVMGWEDYHLHEFNCGGVSFMDPETAGEVGGMSESRVSLNQLLRKPKDKLLYTYDFGDGWQHAVGLEKAVPAPEGQKYQCIKGAMACPMEDSGGIWGHYQKVQLLQNHDPEDPDDMELLEWIGGYDPEAFDLEGINEQLRKLR